MTIATHETASEPVRELIDRFWEEERQELEHRDHALHTLEEALESLNAWTERLQAWQRESDEAEQQAEESHKIAEHRCEEYARECELLRQRVGDLEIALQDRTEELLRAQAANNALAALQSAGLHGPSERAANQDDEGPSDQQAGPPIEFEDPPADGPEVAEPGGSVAERFERLRRQRVAAPE